MVCGAQGAGDKRFGGCVEVDEGRAHPSPAARDGSEDFRLLGDKGLLLLGRQLDHAATFLLRGERREDAPVETKVGMTHMRAFNRSRKTEGEAAKEIDARV